MVPLPLWQRRDEGTPIMSTPAAPDVDDVSKEALSGLATGDLDLLAEGLEMRAEWQAKSGLDDRAYALVKIATLVALDAPPASYLWRSRRSRTSRRKRPALSTLGQTSLAAKGSLMPGSH